MKKTALFLFFILASFAVVYPQNPIGKEINDRDIVWSDFTGEINQSSRFAAETYWAITYKFPAPSVRDGKVYVKATTQLFLRSNSWVRPGKQTQRLLEHEQGHFRIGRICAKDFEQTISSTAFDRYNYAKEVDAIYWAMIKKYADMTKQYDQETNHYHNPEEQARWNKKLEELMKQYQIR